MKTSPLVFKLPQSTSVNMVSVAICYFWFKDKILDEDFYNESKDSIAYAKQKGLELHFAHAWDKETYELGIQRGFTGFQCAASGVI